MPLFGITDGQRGTIQNCEMPNQVQARGSESRAVNVSSDRMCCFLGRGVCQKVSRSPSGEFPHGISTQVWGPKAPEVPQQSTWASLKIHFSRATAPGSSCFKRQPVSSFWVLRPEVAFRFRFCSHWAWAQTDPMIPCTSRGVSSEVGKAQVFFGEREARRNAVFSQMGPCGLTQSTNHKSRTETNKHRRKDSSHTSGRASIFFRAVMAGALEGAKTECLTGPYMSSPPKFGPSQVLRRTSEVPHIPPCTALNIAFSPTLK